VSSRPTAARRTTSPRKGEAFLDEHRDTIDEMFDRVRETVRDFAGGTMGELSQAFTRLAALAWRDAWKHGSSDERTKRIVEILNEASSRSGTCGPRKPDLAGGSTCRGSRW
jgi:hypothetical protein